MPLADIARPCPCQQRTRPSPIARYPASGPGPFFASQMPPRSLCSGRRARLRRPRARYRRGRAGVRAPCTQPAPPASGHRAATHRLASAQMLPHPRLAPSGSFQSWRELVGHRPCVPEGAKTQSTSLKLALAHRGGQRSDHRLGQACANTSREAKRPLSVRAFRHRRNRRRQS